MIIFLRSKGRQPLVVVGPQGGPISRRGSAPTGFRVLARSASRHPLSPRTPWTGYSSKFTRARVRQSRTPPLAGSLQRFGAVVPPFLSGIGPQPWGSGFTGRARGSGRRMLRTLAAPWTGTLRADRKNWPGGHFSSPPAWARRVSVLFRFLSRPSSLRSSKRLGPPRGPEARTGFWPLRRARTGFWPLLKSTHRLLAVAQSKLRCCRARPKRSSATPRRPDAGPPVPGNGRLRCSRACPKQSSATPRRPEAGPPIPGKSELSLQRRACSYRALRVDNYASEASLKWSRN